MPKQASWDQHIGKPFVPTIYVNTQETIYELVNFGGDKFNLGVIDQGSLLEGVIELNAQDSVLLYCPTPNFDMSEEGTLPATTTFNAIAANLAYATICDRKNAIGYAILTGADGNPLSDDALIAALEEGQDFMKVAVGQEAKLEVYGSPLSKRLPEPRWGQESMPIYMIEPHF